MRGAGLRLVVTGEEEAEEEEEEALLERLPPWRETGVKEEIRMEGKKRFARDSHGRPKAKAKPKAKARAKWLQDRGCVRVFEQACRVS